MPEAKVLRLLRHDAKSWWWHRELHKQGRHDEALKLERASIRTNVKDIRDLRELLDEIHVRTNTLTFHRPANGDSFTTSMGGCHPGFFAAFIYCYANKIG